MSPILRQTMSYVTIVGYALVVTWGSAWHDHQHCCSHEDSDCAVQISSAHAHQHCCDHHDHACKVDFTANQADPANAPCKSPLHDDDCVVCQTLAHPPLANPAIEVVDVAEPVCEWVAIVPPTANCPRPSAYDSRGPPCV